MSTRNPPRAPGHEPDPERSVDHDERHEEDRDAILARRALFIASALAGISLAAGCEGGGRSMPCLSIALIQDGGPPPMPCLSPAPPPPEMPPDAGVELGDGGLESDASTSRDASAPDASAAPRRPPPTPMPCLTIAVPNPPPPPPPVKK
jgi:hypothetical protein